MPDVKIQFVASAKSLIQATKQAVKGLTPFGDILARLSDIQIDPSQAEGAFKAMAQSGRLSADAMEASLSAINSVLAETDRLLLAGVEPAQIRARAYQAGVQVAMAYSQAEEGVAAAAQTEAAALAEGIDEVSAKAQAEQAAINAAREHQRSLEGVAASQKQATNVVSRFIDEMGKMGLATQYVQQFAQSAQSVGRSLEQAARVEDVALSFQNLADSSGVAADELLGNMRRAARGTVTDAELMQAANRALLAGGDRISQELPRLFEIARAAAQATGQDVGYVYETLVKGIIKASPLLIDNAEVYIKVGDAVDNYAQKMGKATDELTVAERQQALLNAVLAEGGQFIANTGAAQEAATDKYRRAEVQVEQLKQTFAGWLDELGPIGPALLIISEAATTLTPLILALVAAQQAGVKASLAGVAARTAETAAMWAQANAAKGLLTGQLAQLGSLGGLAAGALTAGAFAAGGLAIKKSIEFRQEFNANVQQVEDRWGQFMENTRQTAQSGIEAVDDYRAAQERVREELHKDGNALEDVARAYVRGQTGTKLMRGDLDKLHDTIVQTSKDYNDYVRAIGQFNSGLIEGEEALGILNPALFEFRQKLAQGQAGLNDLADLIENRGIPALSLLGEGFTSALAGGLRAIEQQRQAAAKLAFQTSERALELQEITGLMNEALGEAGLKGEELAQAQEEISLALGLATQAEVKATSQVTLLTQAYAYGIVGLEDYINAMRAAEQGLLNLSEANIETLQAEVNAAQERERLAQDQERFYQDLTQIGAASLRNLGLAEEQLAEEQKQMALSLGLVTQGQVKAEEQTRLLAQAAALGVISWKTYGEAVRAASEGVDYFSRGQMGRIQAAVDMLQVQQDIAQEEQRVALETEQANIEHQNRMAQIEERAAQRRAAIWEKYYDSLQRARDQRQQAIENATQQHQKRMAQIERQYQQEIDRINQRFGDALEQAEAERNINVYLDAVKQRERDLEDAKKKRDEQKREAEINYREQLDAAQAAYDRQIELAERARDRQLAELRERLVQEREMERARHRERLEETRAALNALLAEYAEFYRRLRAMRVSAMSSTGSGGATGPGTGGGTIPMQHGFEGIVTGPQTFYVEPGVREYVYATPTSPSPMQGSQANVPLGVTVGGTINVDMSGFSDQVVKRWQPLLVQAALDEVTGVITTVVDAQQGRRMTD